MIEIQKSQPDLSLDPHNAQVYSDEGRPLQVSDLAFRAHNSLYGQYMDTQTLRFWDNFGYDRQTMLQDLGPDVHPIGHQNETARHAMYILEADTNHGFTGEQIGIGLFTKRIHDMGESMHPRIAERIGAVVGDVPAGMKTDKQRQIEANVRKLVFDDLFPDVHRSVLERSDALIMHTPKPGDEKIHEWLEAAHDLATFDTALRAKKAWEATHFYSEGDPIDIESDDGGRKSGLLGLHQAVFLRSGLKLLQQYAHFKHVQNVLEPHTNDLLAYLNYRDNLAA